MRRSRGWRGSARSAQGRAGQRPSLRPPHLPTGMPQDRVLARGTHLALAAHLVPLVEALLLGGAQRVPGGNQVTQRDVHLAIAIGFAWGGAAQSRSHTHTHTHTHTPGAAGVQPPLGCGSVPTPTCNQVLLLASCVQRLPTHCRGRRRVDEFDVLVGALKHLRTERRCEQRHPPPRPSHCPSTRCPPHTLICFTSYWIRLMGFP